MDKPFAVVTGASSGIGLELARQLAERGYDLMLASNQTSLDDAARAVESAGGAVVSRVHSDLATPQGVEHVYDHIRSIGRAVDVIALNAGVGMGGGFLDAKLDDLLRLIQLDAVSVVHLAKRIVPDMVARGSGHVLITASIAAITPTPYETVYGPSKAFVKSFAETLREELKDRGVTVTAFMPGPTETNFFRRAGMADTKLGAGPKDDPADVARQAIDAMLSGADRKVTGSLKVKAQAAAMETILPEKTKARLHRNRARPGSAKKVPTKRRRKV
jgi:short-subunit dehydrogenase